MQPHVWNQLGSTVCAIATPPGTGAVAIIRLTGRESIAIVQKIFSKPILSDRKQFMRHGEIRALDGRVIDEVLLLIFRAPYSYTGEETVEIQCHGNSEITRLILELLVSEGATFAMPGEFTFRALINQKLDLSQAEAVQLLIASDNERARKSASDQLQGGLSKQIEHFQDELIAIAATLDAELDYPEENLHFAPFLTIEKRLKCISLEMEHLLATYHEGKIIHDGATLCLFGPPNVGKSSIMNLLLGHDRAIVTPIAGTTRDLLDEKVRIGGLSFRLTDTAGIAETDDPIEREGIRRARGAMEESDLTLVVLDASKCLTESDRHIFTLPPKERSLFIWNKIDLPHKIEGVQDAINVPFSAKTRQGIQELKEAIFQKIGIHYTACGNEVILTKQRHFDALKLAIASCHEALVGCQKERDIELISEDLRAALNHLGAIRGNNVSEEILHSIFSQFCVGK